MRSHNTISGVVGIIIAIWAAVFAVKYGLGRISTPGPGFFPFVICLVLIFLNSLLIIKDFQNRTAVKKIKLGEKWHNIVYLMAASVIYVLFWNVLGFLLNTFLLMWFLLKLLGRESLIKSTIIAFLVSTLSYVIFSTYLGIQFPAGIFNLRF